MQLLDRLVVLLLLGAAPNHSVMECLIIHFLSLSAQSLLSRPACTPQARGTQVLQTLKKGWFCG
jgi:hypothetical protein